VNGPTDLIKFDALNLTPGSVPEFTLVHIMEEDGCFDRSRLGCTGSTPQVTKYTEIKSEQKHA
jgi:hypothetical protein